MSRHRKDKGDGDFKLRIQLGETMRDQFDLAQALQKVIDAVDRGERRGSVSDANGSKVGEFGFTVD